MVAFYAGMSQWGRKVGARKSTKYPGVQARESDVRRHKGKPDICYTIDYRDAAGKRVRKDIGWASEGFTAAYAAQVRAKLIQENKAAEAMGLPPPVKAPTLRDAWHRYKAEWLEPQGKNTEDGLMLTTHLQSLADVRLDQITAHALDTVMNAMRQKGLAAQTIRHAIALVRRIMRRMTKWGAYTGPMPFDQITLPKVNNARQRYLTPGEARQLLDALKARSFQVWLMALISLHCGLRFGEIAALRFGDLRFDDGTIYIRDSKSGMARHAVMTAEVMDGLRQLHGDHEDLIFTNRAGGPPKDVSDTFVRVVEALGFNTGITDARQKVVFHTLRHTYASWLALGGEGEMALAELLGHRSTAMTKRYTHLMAQARRKTAEKISSIFHDN